MRTTIRMDDRLYETIKIEAARRHITVAAIIEEKIRLGMRQLDEGDARPRYDLNTFGGQLQPGIDLSSSASLNQAMDAGVELDALR